MVRELEVPAFAANFGANEKSCAIRFGEPCRVAIALQEGQTFVEDSGLDADVAAERGINGLCLFDVATDQQDFLWVELLKEFDQPQDTWVFGEISLGLQF